MNTRTDTVTKKPQGNTTLHGFGGSYSYDNRYLNRFFKMNTAPLLMSAKVFPNIKEITESVGAFVAIQDHLIDKCVSRTDEVDVYVIGDGHSPRTGALIACLTKWNVKSIDPQMRGEQWGIKRLETYKSKAEELSFEGNNNSAVVVCVHSHAKISDCLKMLHGYSEIHLVNIPCCFKADIDKKPNVSYTDIGIQSEKQKVEIYFNCHQHQSMQPFNAI